MNLKFYAMALFAGMAIGATAADKAPVKFDASLCKPVKIENSLLKKYEGESKNVMRTPATAKDLTGDYTVCYINLLNQTQQSSGFYSGTAMINEEDNGYVVEFPFLLNDAELSITFPVKVTGNTISFEPATVNVGGEEVPCGPYELTNDGMRALDKLEANFTGSGFSFAVESSGFGVGDPTNGWYFFATRLSFQKPDVPDSEMNLGWKSVGKAKLQDGWVTSGLTGGQQSDPSLIWEVELQQNEDDANIYRLVNPYGESSIYGPGGEAEGYNESIAMNGFIQFNVSDPDHVVFEAVPANFSNSNMRIGQVYPINTVGMLIYSYGWTLEKAVEAYGDQLLWSTFKDGVVTIPSAPNGKGGYTNDTCFGVEGNPYGGFGWQDQNGVSTNMESKIWFPDENGVEGVEFDENAPVKYYNLQGVEVANPAKGQLVIKTQGSKTQKMIVR